MVMTLQVACDGQQCDAIEDFSAGFLEDNVAVDQDLRDEGWFNTAGQDYCPNCAPRHRDRESPGEGDPDGRRM